MEESIDGATGMLLNFTGSEDLNLFEVNEAADIVVSTADKGANIIFGTVIDDALGDEVRVTVIAAGFEGGQPPRRQPGISRAADLRTHQTRPTPTPVEPEPVVASNNHSSTSYTAPAESTAPALHPPPVPLPPSRVTVPPRVPSFEDDLDVPDFLK
jgi:cell division protein FtsZ